MKEEMDEFKTLWQDAKKPAEAANPSAALIIARAEAGKRKSLLAQYGNIAILLAVTAMLIVFFYWLFPFGEKLSRLGVHLMVGGVVLRIVIELFSVRRSLRIDLADPALKSTNDLLAFYTFRKKIHGPVTVSIVCVYILGFFLLSPEFSRYMPLGWLIAMDGLFIIGAIILIRVISKGIRQEIKDLKEVAELQMALLNES